MDILPKRIFNCVIYEFCVNAGYCVVLVPCQDMAEGIFCAFGTQLTSMLTLPFISWWSDQNKVVCPKILISSCFTANLIRIICCISIYVWTNFLFSHLTVLHLTLLNIALGQAHLHWLQHKSPTVVLPHYKKVRDEFTDPLICQKLFFLNDPVLEWGQF